MQVTIDAALFTSPSGPFDLQALFRLALKRRHVFLTSPVYAQGQSGSQPIDTWLAQQPQDIQKAVRMILSNGVLEAAGQRPSTLRIRISTAAVSNWLASPPELTLDDGLTFLQAPLVAHVENQESDARLLRAMADPQQRPALQEAEIKGLLRFQGCGGIDELHKRIQAGDGQPSHHLRWWYTSDRDSGEAGGLSRRAHELRDLCQRQRPPIPYGPLSRRMSESYLPLPLIALWSQEGSSKKRSHRRAIYDEFCRMPGTLRHRFEMKQGFIWSLSEERRKELQHRGSRVTTDEIFSAFPDVPRTATNNPEYQYLNALSRDPKRILALQSGLGSKIGEFFDRVAERDLDVWLGNDVSHAERFDLIQTLLDRV